MEGENKGVVCVTGGTGFLASWLIMRLLEHGYSVHATIRSNSGGHAEHKKDVSFLTTLPGASEKLKIFHADLSEPESFDAVINGCIGVFHVATPVDFENKEPEAVVTKRAVDGTLGILKACLKSKTVKRVVYTSSASTVVFNDSGLEIMDESCWSDLDYLKALNFGGSYYVSKTLTEKTALEFAEEHGLDLVALLPSYIIGPFICPKISGSICAALSMVLGREEEYHKLLNTPMVHIDDVARAHIFLLEYPDAKGRYICSSHVLTLEEIATFLSVKYADQFPIPTLESLKSIEGYKLPGVSTKKLLDTGFKYKYGPDEMFDGAIQCCKEKGYL